MTEKKYSIEELMENETIASFTVSPDSRRILYSSDKTGNYNIFELDQEKGKHRQITSLTENALVSHVYKDGSFIFAMDKGGDELHHLYLGTEEKIKDLTPFEKTKSGFHVSVGNSVYYYSNKIDRSRFDLYRFEKADLAGELVFENKDLYELGPISDNERFLALHKPETANNSNVYLHDLLSGDTTLLSPHEGEANFIPLFFSKDSMKLYCLSDIEGEFMTLWITDIKSKEREEILAFSWDIIDGRISEDGRSAVLIVNRDGFSELHIIDTKDNTPKMSPVETGGVVYDQYFSKDSRFLYYLCDSATSSPNIFMIDLNTKETEQLTDSMSEEVNSNDLSEAKVLRFISYDGLQVPGIFYPPRNVLPNEKAPAIVWVHGGPGGQSLPRYSPEIQFIANHGYAIYAVNNRGSSGYGKSFFKAADHKHGEADLDDCVAAAKYLATLDFIDKERIGINGGSYGGFMVLAALAFRPKEFKVGTDFFGVSNWVRTLKEVPAWWKIAKDLLYGKIGNPFTEEEYLKSISPLFHADKIERPLLVLQGVNDPRVLKIESDEIVERLKEHGVPVEYVVFNDEGHGFKKKANRIRGANAMLAFLDKYLR